jgi:hypothetical protein
MVLVDINQFDQQRFYLLVNKVKLTKSNYDSLMNEGEHLKSRRYNDDDRIARMIVGDIYAECKYDIEAAKKKFLALNSIEIEPYIKSAVLESASCDYYYTYEKDWG